jgi:hypothetical protein
LLSRVASLAPAPSGVVEAARAAAGQVIETAAAMATVPVRAMSLLGQAELLVTRITVIADSAEHLIGEVTTIVAQAQETVRSAQTIAAAAALTIEETAALTTAAARIVDEAGMITGEAAGLVIRAGTVTAGAAELIGEAGGVTAEASRLVDAAEAVTIGASGVLEKAERTTDAAGVVLGDASAATAAADTVVDQATAATAEVVQLLDGYLPMLRNAAPLPGRFVYEISPNEVAAAIRMVDELPKLREHLVEDVMPLLGRLDQVGPDLHNLLGVTQDLHLAIVGLPGLKMLRRRGEERVAEEEATTNTRKHD